MEVKKTRIIYNKTAEPLVVAHQGKQVRLDPFNELVVKNEVAETFFKFHKGKVVDADTFEEVQSTAVEKPQTLWVANMTGNTETPAIIKEKTRENKSWVWKDIPNPEHIPMIISEKAAGRWEEMKDNEGELTAKRYPSKIMQLPPFKRIEMLAGVAHWFVGRAQVSLPDVPPGTTVRKCIIARAPTAFEPDHTWDIDELRAYLRYIDPVADVGPPQAEIEKKYRKNKSITEDDVVFRLETVRRELFKRVFFRMVDPSWPNPLPTRKEFEEYMYGLTPPEEPEGKDLVDKVLEQAAA